MSTHQRTSFWIGAILVYFGIMVVTWLVVRHTYCATPQIANFQAFAEPAARAWRSKPEYLYGPLAMQIIIFGVVLLGFRETVTKKLKCVLLFWGLGLGLLLGAAGQSSLALRAAHLSGSIWTATIWSGCQSGRI